jgi:prepilin signal peptidase PulO-like enzyme (type II secretory pathway)
VGVSAATTAPWVAVPAALVGFLLGWLSALLTEWLTAPDEAPKIRWRSPLVRDPLVQGSLALIWAAIPLTVEGDVLRWLEAGLLALPLVQVAVTDFRTRYVYERVALLGTLIGLALGWHFHDGPWWSGLSGAAGGGLVFALAYQVGKLVGRVRYQGQEPLGRGDILIAAMVGAGAANLTVNALFYGVFASALISLAVAVRTRSLQSVMPYGPGLCLGGLVTLFLH